MTIYITDGTCSFTTDDNPSPGRQEWCGPWSGSKGSLTSPAESGDVTWVNRAVLARVSAEVITTNIYIYYTPCIDCGWVPRWRR